MADDNIQQFSIDVGDSVQQTNRLATSLKLLTQRIEGLVSTTVSFNPEGEQLSQSFNTVSKAGDKVVTTFKALRDVEGQLTGDFNLASQSFKQSAQSLSELNKVARDYASIAGKIGKIQPQQLVDNRNSRSLNQQRDATQRALRSTFTKQGSPEENARLNSAIQNVTSNIGKGGIDGPALQAIFQKVTASARELTLEEQKIVNQFKAVEAAGAALGTSYAKQATAAQEASAKQAAAATAAAEKAAAADQARTDRELANLLKTLDAEIAADQKKAAAAEQAAAKATAAEQARDDKEIAGIFKRAQVAQDAYDKQIAAAEKLSAAEQAKAEKQATAAAKKAADDAVAIKRAQDLLSIELAQVKDKATQQNLRSDQSAVLGAGATNVFQKSLNYANPAQIQAFNIALQEALKLFQQGKITAAQFQTALNNIRANTIKTEVIPELVELNTKLIALRDSFNTTGKAGGEAGKDIFLSWQSVAKIFEAQILYSVFGQLQQGFSGSVQSAAEYSQQIALIQTISQDANVTTLEWAQGVRKLSDELGTPITNTAAAAYEALSNQVAKGADAFNFLRTAGDFARTTGSEIKDSVDLISSALNSFGLDASQAERAARSFFTTIDLGRVTTPELANSFGRSGVLAHQLGISLEELNASISTLTRQGIKPNEAYTLLNNVFQKLIKPTEALDGFFKEIGVDSGEAAIQTYGYIGVLSLLDQKFKGSASEAAKYFDEIRGGRGIRNLTGSGLDQVKSDLAQNQNANGNYDNAKNIVNNSFGKQFEDETNKIKNFFVQDVGSNFLKKVLDLSSAVGGLANAFKFLIQIVKVAVIGAGLLYTAFKVKEIITGIQGMRAALAAFNAATVAASVGMGRFGIVAGASIAIATAGISALAAALATIALTFISLDDGSSKLTEFTDKFKAEADERVKISAEAASAFSEEFDKGLQNAITSFNRFAANIRGGLTNVVDKLKQDASGIGDALKAQFDTIDGLIRNSLGELERNLKNVTDDIENINSLVKDAPIEYNRKLFERNVARNDRNVSAGGPDNTLNLYFQRINELRHLADIELFDNGNIKEGDKLLKEAADLADRLAKLDRKHTTRVPVQKEIGVFQERNTINENGQPRQSRTRVGSQFESVQKKVGNVENTPFSSIGEKLALDLLNEYIDKLKQADQIKQAIKARDEAAVNDLTSEFQKLQEAQKKVVAFSVFDKKGDLKERYQDKEAVKDTNGVILKPAQNGTQNALDDLASRQGDVSTALDKLGAGLDTKIHTAEGFAVQNQKLQDILDKQTANVGSTVKGQNQLDNFAKSQSNITSSTQALIASKSKLLAIQNETNEAQAKSIALLKTELETLRQSVNQGGVGNFLKSITGQSTPTNEGSVRTENTFNRAQALIDKPILTDSDSANLKKAIIELISDLDYVNSKTQFFKEPNGQPGNPGQPAPTIGNSVTNLGKGIVGLQGSQIQSKNLVEAFNELKDAQERVQIQSKAIEEQLGKLPGAAKGAGEGAAVGLSPINTEIENIRKNLDSLRNDLEAAFKIRASLPASAATPAPEVEDKATGGIVGHYARGGLVRYLAGGGFLPNGSDTQPAMLTPGEFVMPVNATRQFLPQLEAMRSGKVKTSSGGAMSSTTNVGDIHITVQGGQTAQQTVKDIGQGLRRALRQGTVKLNT